MMEKQNRIMPKRAAGDAGDLDDIVDFASRKLSRVHKTDPRKRTGTGWCDPAPVPEDRSCR